MPKNTNDPLERLVDDCLAELGIAVTYPDQAANYGGYALLDFYLPELDLYIECKAWGSERVHRQIENVNNCVVLIGRTAVEMWCGMMRKTYAR